MGGSNLILFGDMVDKVRSNMKVIRPCGDDCTTFIETVESCHFMKVAVRSSGETFKGI